MLLINVFHKLFISEYNPNYCGIHEKFRQTVGTEERERNDGAPDIPSKEIIVLIKDKEK